MSIQDDDSVPYAATAPVSTVVETTCSAAMRVAGSAIVVRSRLNGVEYENELINCKEVVDMVIR